jgi:hypothetical protein
VQRASQASRPSADDQDVRFELFALDGHSVILADRKVAKIPRLHF